MVDSRVQIRSAQIVGIRPSTRHDRELPGSQSRLGALRAVGRRPLLGAHHSQVQTAVRFHVLEGAVCGARASVLFLYRSAAPPRALLGFTVRGPGEPGVTGSRDSQEPLWDAPPAPGWPLRSPPPRCPCLSRERACGARSGFAGRPPLRPSGGRAATMPALRLGTVPAACLPVGLRAVRRSGLRDDALSLKAGVARRRRVALSRVSSPRRLPNPQ